MVIIETNQIRLPNWKTKEFDQGRYNKLVNVIKQYGQLRTVTVRECKDYLTNEITYEVLEGRNISKACAEAEIPFLWVNNIGEVGDLTAKEISLMLNELEFQTDFVDVAGLVKEIVEDTNVRNASNLSMFDQREVQKFLKIFKFDWEDFNRSKMSGNLSLFEQHLTENNGKGQMEAEDSPGNDEQPKQSDSQLSFI